MEFYYMQYQIKSLQLSARMAVILVWGFMSRRSTKEAVKDATHVCLL